MLWIDLKDYMVNKLFKRFGNFYIDCRNGPVRRVFPSLNKGIS